jgi:hypothetical protein
VERPLVGSCALLFDSLQGPSHQTWLAGIHTSQQSAELTEYPWHPLGVFMTLQKPKSIARHLGLTLRQLDSGNYRVNFRDGNETTA